LGRGIKTNVDMLRLLTQDKQINAGRVNTNWLENWLINNLNYLKSNRREVGK
jgi:biotin carboxylase